MTAKKYPHLTQGEALRLTLSENPKYLGELRGHPIYSTWRSIKFTDKGKRAGCTKNWSTFLEFKEDVLSAWKAGCQLRRVDKSKPYSKENTRWLQPDRIGYVEDPLPLEYEGQIKDLRDWCKEFKIHFTGARQRYVKGKKKCYDSEGILFGIKIAPRRKLVCATKLPMQKKRNKASKMISSYRCSDKKKDMICDLETDWFIQNILEKECSYCGTKEFLGADRLDNSVGHIKSNIVPACYRCNNVRKDYFTFDEMIKIGGFLKEEIYSKRKI